MSRTDDEGVGLEDLDALQTEIELMLINVTRRSIAIDNEVDALTNWQESQCKPHRDKKSSPSKSSTESPTKRKSVRAETEDGRPVKRALKDSSCSSMSSSASTVSSLSSSNTPAKSHTKSKSKNIAVSYRFSKCRQDPNVFFILRISFSHWTTNIKLKGMTSPIDSYTLLSLIVLQSNRRMSRSWKT